MDEDTRSSGDDGEKSYLVGPNLPGKAGDARGEVVAFKLRDTIRRLTQAQPLNVRMVTVGGAVLISSEVFTEDALCLAHLLWRLAGSEDDDPMAASSGDAANLGARRDRMDFAELHPTWYAVRRDVEYMDGLEPAFHAREVLREVLNACLPSGPLSVTPLARLDGRGAVRFKLTVSDAERLRLLLCYVGGRLQRGGGRT